MAITKARPRLATLLIALALAAAADCGAQARLPSLERLGFKLPASAPDFACEGQDLRGRALRVGPGTQPAIVYLFLPSQASARATIAALERLSAAYEGRVAVLAATKAEAATSANALKGLKVGFPVVAGARGLGPYDPGAAQAFLVLAPGGKPLGLKAGPLDWSSEAAKALVEELAAAYPVAAAAASAAEPPAPAAPPPAATPPQPPAAPAQSAPAPAAPPAPALSASPIAPPAVPVPPAPPAVPAFMSAVEAEVVAELSLARTQPKAYADFLREYRSHIRGNLYEQPGEISIMLNEGTRAVDEAIAFLDKQKPIAPLAASRGLTLAAKDHAKDQGPRGATGHTGSDGSDPFQRMERYGSWKSTAGENCAYGSDAARDIVIQLLVDDGVPSRGHRANIFNPKFLVVGVAVGPHKGYGTVCVQDFAGGFADK